MGVLVPAGGLKGEGGKRAARAHDKGSDGDQEAVSPDRHGVDEARLAAAQRASRSCGRLIFAF